MKKLVLSVMILLALPKANKSETVPLEKAKAVAAAFLNSSQNNSANKSISTGLKLVYTENSKSRKATAPAYFIFTREVGEGFVIIAGDDSVDPIIGYSFENTFDINNLPPNFVSYMEAQAHAIEKAGKSNLRTSAETEAKWNISSAAPMAVIPIVPELLKARWGQFSPYNDKCPLQGGQRTLVGCTAVAQGQIMHYWHYPAQGAGTYGGVNFGATTYDWANMPNWVNASSTVAQKNAVSTLLWHCGVSVDMKYGLGGSGAFYDVGTWEANFRYSTDAKKVYKSNYTIDEWKDLLKTELDNFRPVAYSGFSDNSAHSWVVDGYDNIGKFHMNWGWDGGTGANTDGYYQITDLEPGDKEYQYKNEAVIGIQNPNRLTLSAISTTQSVICSKTSFVCSVTDNPKVVTYLWTVPSGWTISGVVSTGVPVSLGRSVTITPPSDAAVLAQPSITVSVSGLTSYGERTQTKALVIGTGKATYTHKVVQLPGEAEHTFIATKGAIIQYSANGSVWKNDGNVHIETVYNFTRSVYIRTSNVCGVGTSTKFTMLGQIDPNDKNLNVTSIEEKTNQPTEIVLYPTPVTDNVFIQADQPIKSVHCYNSIGQLMDVKLSGNSVAVSNLPSGVYFLSVSTEKGDLVTKKFIKE